MEHLICTADALTLRAIPEVRPDTDTGKRIIKGQACLQYGLSLDGKWSYVIAPAGNGWASNTYLIAQPIGKAIESLPTPAWPKVPIGLDGIKVLFGEPGNPLCHAGRVTLPKPLSLSWSPKETTLVFACHKLVEDVFQSVFDEIARRGFVDFLEDYGGCYEYRDSRTTSKLSTHAWGITIDLNANANPLGGKSQQHAGIVGIFKDHGFVWGGDFAGRKDPMHFQYAKGY